VAGSLPSMSILRITVRVYITVERVWTVQVSQDRNWRPTAKRVQFSASIGLAGFLVK
jgi:hypothetical protein